MKISSTILFLVSLTSCQVLSIRRLSSDSSRLSGVDPIRNNKIFSSPLHSPVTSSPSPLLSSPLPSSTTSSTDGGSFEQCFNETDPAWNDEALFMGPKEYSRTLIRGSHKFSLGILKFLSNFESKDSSPGLLVSPFSVWSALITTLMGSKGETEAEIKAALDIKEIPKQSVGMSYQGLRLWYQLKKNSSSDSSSSGPSFDTSSSNLNSKYSYSAANRIFVNSKLTLNKCITQHFPDEIQSLDFTDSSSATKTINSWVERVTNKKIKDLMASGSITPWTQIIIANGIYFRSQWLYQFDSGNNEQRNFHVNPAESIEATFMTQTGNFMYGVSERLKATIIDMPYANQQFSMLIFLPETSRGVDGLIRVMQPSDIYDVVSNMYDDEVEVTLPKFKMEQEFDLAGPLYSMGIKSLFDPRFADLSGFFEPEKQQPETSSNVTSGNVTYKPSSSNNQKGVTINTIIHKSMITVDEEGTEAAAATAFLIARSGRPAYPTKFLVDRPFLFMIRDTATNVILFIGVVRRPS